jgi:PKD repeat protein
VDDGRTLRLTGNSWRSVDLTYDVTERTVLRFDFASPSAGEIHGVGFETDERQSSDRFFRLYGSQSYGRRDLGYAGGGEFRTYEAEPGPGYPDETSRYLVFVNDDDRDGSGVSEFRDVVVYERDDYAYEWDWDGDGSYDATGQQPTHTFASRGTYEVGVRVTAPDGRTTTTERTVVVRERAPPPTADAVAAPDRVGTDEPVTLDATGSTDPLGDGLTYDWDVDGDGAFERTGATVTASYDDPGRYVARLRVTDGEGRTATATVPVVVRAGERDPGFAYSDRNGNGVYDDADGRVDAAELDGQYQSDDPLVVPDSAGTIDAGGRQVQYEVPELVLNATVRTRNQVQIETAGDATVGGTVDTAAGGSGYGGVEIEAGGDLRLRNGSVRSKAPVQLDGRSVTLTDATVDTYQGGSGYGGVRVETDGGPLVADGATVRSKAPVELTGESVNLTDATVDAYVDGSGYGSVTVDAGDRELTARNAELRSVSSVELSGDGVDLTGATVDNYVGGSGYGETSLDGGDGDVELVGSTVDSGRTASVAAGGVVDVADARVRHGASPLAVSGTVVNEGEMREGSVA